jgi:hypothetical protein
MYSHVVQSHPPLPVSEATIETTLLFLGVVRQLEFFGRAPSGEQDPAVAAIQRTVDEWLSNNAALQSKYAKMTLRQLKAEIEERE